MKKACCCTFTVSGSGKALVPVTTSSAGLKMFRMAAGIDNSNEKRGLKIADCWGSNTSSREKAKGRTSRMRQGGLGKKTNKLVGTCLPTYFAYLKEGTPFVKKFIVD
jgi:hypothetical protein